MAKEEIVSLPYNPSDKDKEAQGWAYEAFDIMWENSSREYPQFNGLTLVKYLDMGRSMFNLLSRPRSDGRSNIKSVAPLNKLMAILARVATKRPLIEVDAENKDNLVEVDGGNIIKDLYEYSLDNIDEGESSDVRYFFDAFDCESDGTIIKYEGNDNQTHTRKTITSYNPETGDVEFEPEEFRTNKVFSQTILPEDFFIWNPLLRDVQKQPKLAWRSVFDWAHFKHEFGNYRGFKFVVPKVGVHKDLDESRYQSYWNNRLSDNQVEVLRVFDRFTDRMVIVANGVVMQDTPLIWNNGEHKRYPFAKSISAPFAGGEFFWGMHLAFKLKGDVSALDTLYNLGIEQAKLSVNPPVLTTQADKMENNMLLSGRVIEVNDIANFKELNFKSPDSSYFNFVKLMSGNIDLASVDATAQGQAQSGVTARGQVIAEENARKLLSQFNMMMESLVLQCAKLRIPNVIQFQLLPGTEIRNRTLVDGRQGVREIKIVTDKSEFDNQRLIDMIEKRAEIQGVNLERLNVTADYIRSLKYTTRVLSESSFMQGKSIQIGLETEKQATVAKFYPNIFQGASDIFFRDLMEAYEDDPDKYLDAVKESVNAKGLGALQQAGQEGQQGQQGNSELIQGLTGNDSVIPKLGGAE